MRVAIDIRAMGNQKSGVGYYVTNLVEGLHTIDTTNHYCLISNDENLALPALQKPNFHHHHTSISHENHLVGDLWENSLLPRFLRNEKVDVFHGPVFMVPLFNKGTIKTVATIHDLVSFDMPTTIPLKYGVYMRALITQVCKRSNKIITDSASTKKDIIRWLKTPEDKITVVPLAVHSHFTPADTATFETEREKVKRQFSIRDRYLLFVGNLEPRKNLVRIMESFMAVRAKMPHDYQLIICGKKGWLYEEILETHQRCNDNNSIILTNYVNEDDLLRLYQYTDLFVFPTLHEGFGLPVLEAMASGAPVMTSTLSSLPEITGNAAALVDPTNNEEIAATLLDLCSHEEKRQEMSRNGLIQAATFSWGTTAAATHNVYRAAFEG